MKKLTGTVFLALLLIMPGLVSASSIRNTAIIPVVSYGYDRMIGWHWELGIAIGTQSIDEISRGSFFDGFYGSVGFNGNGTVIDAGARAMGAMFIPYNGQITLRWANVANARTGKILPGQYAGIVAGGMGLSGGILWDINAWKSYFEYGVSIGTGPTSTLYDIWDPFQ